MKTQPWTSASPPHNDTTIKHQDRGTQYTYAELRQVVTHNVTALGRIPSRSAWKILGLAPSPQTIRRVTGHPQTTDRLWQQAITAILGR